MNVTEKDIADWMLEELQRNDGYLYQHEIVEDIEEKFGEQFVYENDNGNLAISKKVLNEFKKLTQKSVVWERGEKCWRLREEFDDPDRRSTDY